MESVQVYKDRDNSFTLTLEKNGTTLTRTEMDAITRVEIKYNGTYYNSVDNAPGFLKDAANGQITIKPYELSLDASRDTVELIVYDAGNYTHGLVWTQFRLVVSNEALPI